ncbi:MAG TPA: hypothetical protein VLT47_01815 [Anaeromyxobacteraceae bacterium]|nr:hypothetical protein [Anaeromyxobacteraceae bacterium]
MPMPCAHLQTCPMYALFTVKESLRVWQIHYCNGRFEACARLKLARAGEPVPHHLLPNGKTLDRAVSR